MTIVIDGKSLYDHQHWLVARLRPFRKPYAAEIGVASGRTSEILLREVPNLQLLMVDQWRAPQDHPRRDQSWYDRACETATNRTAFASDRRQIVRQPSVEAVQSLAPILDGELFDLVFIDACHVYESVLEDCHAWWDLVKPGGVFSGHDIDSAKDRSGIWGVRKAVEEFCAEKQLTFDVWKNIWFIDKG